MWTKGRSTMRKDSANNKSSYSEKEPPNLDSRSRRFALERVFGERGDVKNIFLPTPEARIFSATSSPGHHRRRWSGVGPFGLGLRCSISAAASSLLVAT